MLHEVGIFSILVEELGSLRVIPATFRDLTSLDTPDSGPFVISLAQLAFPSTPQIPLTYVISSHLLKRLMPHLDS
jgi:hypothetical protein